MVLAIPKLACDIDGLDWRAIRSMLEILFRSSGVKVLVCGNHFARSTQRLWKVTSIELPGADDILG